jgi:hypothetical protein
MAVDVTPYLELNDFVGMFGRTLSASESTLASTLLLPASGVAIRNAFTRVGKTPPDVNDPMAKLVTYDLVAAALAVPAQYLGHTAYERQTDDRMESGTLTAVAATLEITDHHRVMLGLSASAAPAYGGFEGYDVDAAFTGASPYTYVDAVTGVTYGAVAIGDTP